MVEEDDICIEETIEVQRLIYRHSKSVDFRIVVIEIENCKSPCLQYFLMATSTKSSQQCPHGNGSLKRSQKPYIRTKKSVLEKIKKSSLSPKKTMSVIIKIGVGGGGGEKI